MLILSAKRPNCLYSVDGVQAYIPNVKVDYLSETHGAVSFDGKKFCAVSNWGAVDGQVQTYVVDITGLCSSSVCINKDFHGDLTVDVSVLPPAR